MSSQKGVAQKQENQKTKTIEQSHNMKQKKWPYVYWNCFPANHANNNQ